MSDTDTTYGMTARPSAIGDLRFAGTVAAGLVVGTLGLGALAAPLVGWKDWPSALSNDVATPLTLASPKAPATAPGGSRGERPDPGGNQVPGGAAPALVVGLPGGGGGAGTGAGVSALVGGGGGSSNPASDADPAPRRTFDSTDPIGPRTTASEATGTRAHTAASSSFATADEGDDDNDGLNNAYETANFLNPANPTDARTTKPNGISALTEYHIMSAALDKPDTNRNGVLDGDDDSDRDGVSNAREEANGSDPAKADTNGDSIPDGMDDRDGDGYPDGLPVPTAPATIPVRPVTDTPVEVTPPVERPPVDEHTTPPVETPAPPTSDPAPPAPPANAPAPPRAPEKTPAPKPAPPAPEAPAPPAAPAHGDPATKSDEAKKPPTDANTNSEAPAQPKAEAPKAPAPAAPAASAAPEAPAPEAPASSTPAASEPAPTPAAAEPSATPAPSPVAEAPADPAATPAY